MQGCLTFLLEILGKHGIIQNQVQQSSEYEGRVKKSVLVCVLQTKVVLAQDQEELENELRNEQQRIEAIDADAKRLADETNALKNK